MIFGLDMVNIQGIVEVATAVGTFVSVSIVGLITLKNAIKKTHQDLKAQTTNGDGRTIRTALDDFTELAKERHNLLWDRMDMIQENLVSEQGVKS